MQQKPIPHGFSPVSRTVYSIYWPETRAVVDELWAERPHLLYERNYMKSQDAMHEPFFATWREWSGMGLGDAFQFQYPTNGASEAIDHLIIPPGRVHVFEGEYEGYAAIAVARGMEVRRYIRSDAPHPGLLPRGSGRLHGTDTFFVSLPSSIDGEYWGGFDAWCSALYRMNPHVRVIVDVTYVGAVRTTAPINVARHPNIAAVVFSLSKPFGVYYHRIGGIMSRMEIRSLYGNQWFKNLFSLELGTRLMERYRVDELPQRYAAGQTMALHNLQRGNLLPASARCSNVVMLARSTDGPEEYGRASGMFRYCLSPTMDHWFVNPERTTP